LKIRSGVICEVLDDSNMDTQERNTTEINKP
jgi:hypothetical protein